MVFTLRGARNLGNLLGFFEGANAFPLVRGPHPAGINIGQPELVWCPVLGIACNPLFRDLDKAKCLQLT
jgi:hypothetical protein